MPTRKHHGRPRGGKAVSEKRLSWKVDEFNVQIACGFINRKDTKEDIYPSDYQPP